VSNTSSSRNWRDTPQQQKTALGIFPILWRDFLFLTGAGIEAFFFVWFFFWSDDMGSELGGVLLAF